MNKDKAPASGRKEHPMGKSEAEIILSNAAYEASIKLEKARTALRTTIDNFDLDNTNMTERDSWFLACNVGSICNMLEIVDDYIFEANKQLGSAGNGENR